MMIKVIWYTLEDLLSEQGYLPSASSESDQLKFLNEISSFSLTVDTLIYDGLNEADKTLAQGLIDALMRVVYAKYYNWHCLRKEIPCYSDTIPAITSNDLKELYIKLINIINMTFNRYWVLFNSYKKYQDDPTAKMESSDGSVTRFNDTPQNSGLYDDDNHTSHITQYEHNSSMDSASIMKRLEEVNENWRSILYAWSNEFKGLFIKED